MKKALDSLHEKILQSSLAEKVTEKEIDALVEAKKMTEYKIVYRHGDVYQIIDKIFSEDSAYMVLTVVIKAGYEDCRIEEV